MEFHNRIKNELKEWGTEDAIENQFRLNLTKFEKAANDAGYDPGYLAMIATMNEILCGSECLKIEFNAPIDPTRINIELKPDYGS